MNTAIYGKFTLKKQDCQAGKYPLILKNESSIIMADREQNTLSKYVIIYILWIIYSKLSRRMSAMSANVKLLIAVGALMSFSFIANLL